MRAIFENLATACADRLTVQERWLVLGFVGLVVLGSFVKYSRAQPKMDPSSVPSLTPSMPPSTDDPQ